MLALTIPFPPSANHLHTVARGRKILSEEGRNYFANVSWRLRRQYGTRIDTFDVPLFVVYHVWSPDRRRRDMSNLLKAMEDALTYARVWKDDSLIDDFRVRRAGLDPNRAGYVDVVIQTMQEAGVA